MKIFKNEVEMAEYFVNIHWSESDPIPTDPQDLWRMVSETFPKATFNQGRLTCHEVVRIQKERQRGELEMLKYYKGDWVLLTGLFIFIAGTIYILFALVINTRNYQEDRQQQYTEQYEADLECSARCQAYDVGFSHSYKPSNSDVYDCYCNTSVKNIDRITQELLGGMTSNPSPNWNIGLVEVYSEPLEYKTKECRATCVNGMGLEFGEYFDNSCFCKDG